MKEHEVVAWAEWTDSMTLVVWCKTCHAEIACFHRGEELPVARLTEIENDHIRKAAA